MFKLFILTLLLFCTTLTVANPSLTLAYVDGLKPYSYTENNIPKGIDIEVAKSIFNILNIKVNFIAYENHKLTYALFSKQVDGATGMFDTPKSPLTNHVNFSQAAYDSPLSIYGNKNSNEVTTLSQLTHSAIGDIIGYPYPNSIEQIEWKNRRSMKSTKQLVLRLKNGQFDYIIVEDDVFINTLTELKINNTFNRVFNDSTPIAAIVLHKNLNDSQKLIELINIQLKKLEANGTIEEIFKRFNVNQPSALN